MDHTAVRIRGPIAPSHSDNTLLNPVSIDRIHISEGMWADWQSANATTSLDHAINWVEKEGTVDNFRRLASIAGGHPEWKGMWFNDSNLYKTLESAAWDLAREHDPSIQSLIVEYAAIISRAQESDGYLNTFVQAGLDTRWNDLAKSHELFCIGHLIQAGIAHRRAVGESLLFDTARRAADAVTRDFGNYRRTDLDGHEEIEIALVELYRETGDGSYLQLAQQFVDLRGQGTIRSEGHFDSTYYQDAVPVREQTTVVGHAVRALFLLVAMADLYIETGEEALLSSVIAQWESMTASKTYLNGALGSRIADESFGDAFELPADLAYGETCATVANVMLSMRLLLITGQSRYADAIERGLYNLIAASTGLDRASFFYSNPAQRRTIHAAASAGTASARAEAPGTRPEWFACSCCPSNVMRVIASLASYVASTDASGIQLHQFLPARMAFEVAGADVRLTTQTRYPFDGAVEVLVEDSPGSEWTLSIRIPDWSRVRKFVIKGDVVEINPDSQGYVRITANWEPGDSVRFDLGVSPRLTAMHPSIDAMRGTLAIERGPLVYALESKDQLDGVDLDRVEISPDTVMREVSAQIAGQRFVSVVLRGRLRDDSGWANSGWGDPVGVSDARTVELTAIPYYLWANRGPSTMRIHIPVPDSDPDRSRR
jgi:uncharacterized protein